MISFILPTSLTIFQCHVHPLYHKFCTNKLKTNLFINFMIFAQKYFCKANRSFQISTYLKIINFRKQIFTSTKFTKNLIFSTQNFLIYLQQDNLARWKNNLTFIKIRKRILEKRLITFVVFWRKLTKSIILTVYFLPVKDHVVSSKTHPTPSKLKQKFWWIWNKQLKNQFIIRLK